MRVHAFAVAGGVALTGLIAVPCGAQSSSPAVPEPAPISGSGCLIADAVPNLAALPSGTRVFFEPVLSVEHVRPGSPRTIETREFAGDLAAKAEIRDGAVYVRDQTKPVITLDREPVRVKSRVQVCTFPPGIALPAQFATVTPNVITR